jgi:hypothetical protein
MAVWIIIACCTALFLMLFRKRESPYEIAAKSKPRRISSADVMGKTKVVLRQTQTIGDMRGQVLKPIEDPYTFTVADENDTQGNEPMGIEVPVEYDGEIPGTDTNETDEETEDLRQTPGSDEGLASGASFEELEYSLDVIREKKTSEDDEMKAAEIIRREGGTDIFQQMVSQLPQGVERVSSIMDKYFSVQPGSAGSSSNKELGDFDIAGIL